MKIGIISDIHANLPALQAVLARLDQEDCVKILCCGDVVGYGGNPRECVDLVRQRNLLCVRGNHDHMAAYPGREALMRADVRRVIQWTRETLDKEAFDWLAELPMEVNYAGINVVHSSHVFRPEWHYVVDERSICANFLFQSCATAFNGHTHLPLVAIHNRGSRPRLIMLRDFDLPRDDRCMINVGSVGQPRDRHPQAACAVFETRTRRVSLFRVDYDVALAQKAIRNADLPAFFAERLGEGR